MCRDASKEPVKKWNGGENDERRSIEKAESANHRNRQKVLEIMS